MENIYFTITLLIYYNICLRKLTKETDLHKKII